MTQFDLLGVSDPLNFEIFNIQDGGGCHLKNLKTHDFATAVLAISMKFGMRMQFDAVDHAVGQEHRTASSCQILLKSLEPQLRMIFNGLTRQGDMNCIIVPNFVKIVPFAAEIW